MMLFSPTNSVALLSVALLFALACESRITGNEGNLEFSYPADDRPGDFNKPIAVGALLELKVAEAGTRRRVELESVGTDDAGVLSVVSFSGERFILQGEGAGNTLVSVSAKLPSGSVADSVNMMARIPEILRLRHTCLTGSEAHYLVDQDVVMPFDMEMANGQPVIGYGYHPVDVEPADGIALDATSKSQQFMFIRTGEVPRVVTLSSQIDSTVATMVLVDKSDVDGCRMNPGQELSTPVGMDRVYYLQPTVGGEPVCQAKMQLVVASTTPEVCSVSLIGEPAGPEMENEDGWIRVTPHAAGTCEFTAEFVEGTDATEVFTLEVVEV